MNTIILYHIFIDLSILFQKFFQVFFDFFFLQLSTWKTCTGLCWALAQPGNDLSTIVDTAISQMGYCLVTPASMAIAYTRIWVFAILVNALYMHIRKAQIFHLCLSDFCSANFYVRTFATTIVIIEAVNIVHNILQYAINSIIVLFSNVF